MALFRQSLPTELVDSIEPATLRLEPASFVDQDLWELHRDLVFSARHRDGTDLVIYVLVEHQSKVDPLLPYRMLRYVVRVLEEWARTNPDARRLPAVFSLVLHQGPGPWTGPKRLSDLVALPANLASAGRYMPALEVAFQDLGDANSAERILAMRGPALLRLAMLLLRAAVRGLDLAATLLNHAEIVREIVREVRGYRDLRTLVVYTLSVGGSTMADKVRDSLREAIGPAADSVVKTAADELIEQGLEQGRKSLARVLEHQLRARFGELSPSVLERLGGGSLAQLEEWAVRVMTAKRVDEVFSKPSS